MKKLNKNDILSIIPHSGKMCLLDTVESWNELSIDCTAKSHYQQDNPLRNDNELPIVALIEYGAQAIAVHSYLTDSEQKKIDQGFLASLREVKLYEENFVNYTSVIDVHGSRLFASNGNFIYQMEIRLKNRVILTGKATIMTGS